MFTFAPFCPDSMPFCPDDRQEDSRSSQTQGVAKLKESQNSRSRNSKGQGSRTLESSRSNECRLMPVCYIESMQQRDTPPPFAERQVPFTPIIFRTKNTAKSRLGRLEKISEKICGKMFRGKRKAPNLVERGLGAKIRKIDLRMQR